MSRISEKLEQINKDGRSSRHSREYIEAVWLVLVAFGGALSCQDDDDLEHDGWLGSKQGAIANYYGSGDPEVDLQKTLTAIEKIKEHGINWAALRDPFEQTMGFFNGTFTSSQLNANLMWGKLTLNNGEHYWWAAGVKCEFGELVRVLTLELTLDEALEHLEERATNPHASQSSGYMFKYYCSVPRL